MPPWKLMCPGEGFVHTYAKGTEYRRQQTLCTTH